VRGHGRFIAGAMAASAMADDVKFLRTQSGIDLWPYGTCGPVVFFHHGK